jgi:hypothetical protein
VSILLIFIRARPAALAARFVIEIAIAQAIVRVVGT